MWNATNQRIKALQAARTREKERRSRPIYIRRVEVELEVQATQQIVPARMLLNEVFEKGGMFFGNILLAPNLDIKIKMLHPKPFEIKAQVRWSQYQPSSNKIQREGTSYPYRYGLSFTWENEAELKAFAEFCTLLRNGYTDPNLKSKIDGTQLSDTLAPVIPIASATTTVEASNVAAPSGDATTPQPEAKSADTGTATTAPAADGAQGSGNQAA